MRWDEKNKWNENLWNSEMWRNEMRKRKVKANGNIKGSGSNSTSLCTWVPQCHWNSSLKFWKLKKIVPVFITQTQFFEFWVMKTTLKKLSKQLFFFCEFHVFWIMSDETELYNSVPPNPNILLSSYFYRLQLFEYSPCISIISHALHF